MESSNPGSFGSAIGAGGDALQEAMARRATGGPATGVVSPASAGASANAPLPAPVSTGNVLPAQNVPQEVSQPSIGLPPGSGESQIIIKALDSRLKSLSKLQEMGISV